MTLIEPALLTALMLLAAIIGGYVAVLARAPRVVGYLAGGMALHYLLQYFATGDAEAARSVVSAADNLSGLKTLALGLIMFSIGDVFEVKHVKSVGLRILRVVLMMETGVFVLVSAGCLAFLLLAGDYAPAESIAFAVLLGAVATATAPAATLMVLREYEAKGANTDAVLSMTAVNNIACIVLFHAIFLTLSSAGVIDSSYGADRRLWLDLLVTSVGSVALGILLGFVFSILYAKITVADFMLIFIGVALLLGVFENFLARSLHLSFNYLLTFLFCGAAFTNITPDQDAFRNALRTVAGPIFALFFVLAGFELHLSELPNLGLVGAAYVFFRLAGKTLGGWLGARAIHVPGEIYSYIGFGMLCQAGVAIGLANFLCSTWGSAGPENDFISSAAAVDFKTIILGAVVIFEVLGPICLKTAAVAAGEVKAVTLIRRRRTPGNQSGSVTRRSWEALLSALRLGRPRKTRAVDTLQVRHIMRSGIKVLPASVRFDEVLHFAERSRLNHFPVVDDHGRYIGMIHFSDLRHIMYDPAVRDLVTAHDLSRADTPLARPDMPLMMLFDLFHTTDAASLAVVDDHEHLNVVGIVEERDLLMVLRRCQ